MDRGRWALKKAARGAVAVTTSAALSLRRSEIDGRSPEIRAFTYHRFGDSELRAPFLVSAERFAQQMRWLADHELAVSLKDVQEFLGGQRELRDGCVLVTIDDGFESVFTHALPVLQRYGIPAVAYVSAGFVDAPSTLARERPERYMTWDELSMLQAAGVAIGSHAHTHRSLGRLMPSEVRDEAARSREVLEARLGRPVTSFAYPFGTPSHYTDETGGILTEVGYDMAFVSTHGCIGRGHDPMRLPRIKVEGGEPMWMFRRCCSGAMDTWAVMDHLVSRWRSLRGIAG
ncbi:MAG: polysaccharide deacetylase family protein [Candidatus Bipolaricaulota bacterium]|nr:MAG: polysaccharide deacetylase family protein [Candidatus Bipolaricaulota bacterium]